MGRLSPVGSPMRLSEKSSPLQSGLEAANETGAMTHGVTAASAINTYFPSVQDELLTADSMLENQESAGGCALPSEQSKSPSPSYSSTVSAALAPAAKASPVPAAEQAGVLPRTQNVKTPSPVKMNGSITAPSSIQQESSFRCITPSQQGDSPPPSISRTSSQAVMALSPQSSHQQLEQP